VSLIVF